MRYLSGLREYIKLESANLKQDYLGLQDSP